MTGPLDPIILDQIKSNLLTPPNDLQIIYKMPPSTTVINDDLTLVTHTMVCRLDQKMIVVVYLDIDDGQGSQAIDAFVL